VQGVLAKALGVGCISQPAAIIRNIGVANRKKRLSLRELISIKQHLFRRVPFCRIAARSGRPAPLAAVDPILQPLLGARVIPPTAVAVGNGDIGLLHMAQHLLVKLFAQASKRRHHRLSIGILGLQICGHIWIVLVPQPGVVVRKQHSVHSRFGVNFAHNWRRGQRILAHFYPSVSVDSHPAKLYSSIHQTGELSWGLPEQLVTQLSFPL